MRIFLLLFCCLAALPMAGAELQFNFGELAADGSLTNFHAELLGDGPPPSWQILPGKAPSAFPSLNGQVRDSGGGSVLAQTSQNPADERFPMFVYDGDKFRDFHFTTRFEIVSGVTEQMAGVVFRFQNASNFYVVRVSALGKNIRFYKVVDGNRSPPIGPTCDVALSSWHELSVRCEGTQITIGLDGQPVMPALGDNTFSAGKIGFWTKSDAVTYFAGATLEYTPIVPPGQQLINQTLALEPRVLGLQIYALNSHGAPFVLASKNPQEQGQPGTPAELNAIKDGTVSFGRQHDAVLVTLPLHDRNGEYIAAVRLKLTTFLGETQNNAVTRALMIIKRMEQFGTSTDDLLK